MTTEQQQQEKVLISGGEGMLGHTLDQVFTRVNFSVQAPSRSELDITRREDISHYLDNFEPQVVLNSAAFTNVDACEEAYDRAFEINATGAGLFAEHCRERSIPFVHFSTDYVFDGTSDSPYCESDACNPINAYGETKRAGEQQVLERHPNALVIRSAWLYGAYGANFIDTMREGLRKEEEVSVVDDQTGSPTWTFVLAHAVRHLLEEGESGLFHATCKGRATWYEVAEFIQEQLDGVGRVCSISSDELDRQADRPAFSVLDTAKLEETGFAPPHWKEALTLYLSARQKEE